ncbi:phosphoethanolamine transferase [Algibacter mikhailovii]|uniref:phosphoethanolamine transferase n=1 Tax=Algibacter mikhailovii TaxID=425498 RepID=UPI00249464C8|nr:phosphoethanolamine transferase [Algibacter mikhailovii]
MIKQRASKFADLSNLKPNKTKAILFFIGLLLVLKLSTLIIFNLPYLILKSTFEYFGDFNKIENYKNLGKDPFENVSRASNETKQEVFVIIIGESTSKSHMGIYGYHRETTPLLEDIEEELIVYRDVISPHTYTTASLAKCLTLGNFENPEGNYEGSIIQLLNQSNFKTYWISNQRPVGIFESQITKLGMQAHKSFFLNTRHTNENTNFDEVLLEKLNEVLLDDGNKKVLFLHMVGAHINYKKRYPENFKYFKNSFETKYNNKRDYEVINAYDNAVRYSDYVIRNVIESIRNQNVNSFVLYFSDHGEEVYDDIDFSGHSADQIITKNIYEIPLFLWASDKYKRKKKIDYNLGIKYMTDDLFHSIADLTDVKANQVDSTRSIFSKYFKERKRIIRDTIDYDIFFK